MSNYLDSYDSSNGMTKLRIQRAMERGDKELDVKDAESNPLCKFNLDKVRTRQVHEMLELAAKDTKIDQLKSGVKYVSSFECDLGPPQGFHLNKMEKYAERLPAVGLLPEWERIIRDSVPEKLRKKFSHVFELHMSETKQRYHEAIHKLGVQSVISGDWPIIDVPPYKMPGRTAQREKFIENRRLINRRYLLSHKLVKNIFSRAISLLPKLICDFGRYRAMGFLDLTKFLDAVERDMRLGRLAITKTYYTDIVKLVSQPRYIHDVPSSMVPNLMRGASKLLGYRVTVLIMKTIEHFLDILSNEMTNPLLLFELRCESNELHIVPSIDDVHVAMHALLDNISNVAHQLAPLESWIDVKTPNEFIAIVIPKWYLESSHNQLNVILGKKCESLYSYLNILRNKFMTVYDTKTHDAIVAYVAEEHSFEDCGVRLEDFNSFIRQINGMAYNIDRNGLYHCTVRYKQLLNLHEHLVKDMDVSLPPFPPK